MNTPAHLLLGWAAFGRNAPRGVVLAALAGGLLPDLSLYVLAGTSLFLLGIPPATVFGELYFSATWQAIFAVDNSFVVWAIGLLCGLYLRKRWVVALCGAALIHLAMDFPLHHDDGRSHFWPISRWIFESPVSYWDRNHHAGIVAPLEGVLASFCALLIVLPDWRNWRTVCVFGLVLLELIAVLPGFFISF